MSTTNEVPLVENWAVILGCFSLPKSSSAEIISSLLMPKISDNVRSPNILLLLEYHYWIIDLIGTASALVPPVIFCSPFWLYAFGQPFQYISTSIGHLLAKTDRGMARATALQYGSDRAACRTSHTLFSKLPCAFFLLSLPFCVVQPLSIVLFSL